jgi:hypothetical protein
MSPDAARGLSKTFSIRFVSVYAEFGETIASYEVREVEKFDERP